LSFPKGISFHTSNLEPCTSNPHPVLTSSPMAPQQNPVLNRLFYGDNLAVLRDHIFTDDPSD